MQAPRSHQPAGAGAGQQHLRSGGQQQSVRAHSSRRPLRHGSRQTFQRALVSYITAGLHRQRALEYKYACAENIFIVVITPPPRKPPPVCCMLSMHHTTCSTAVQWRKITASPLRIHTAGMKVDVDFLNPTIAGLKEQWSALPEPVREVAPFAGTSVKSSGVKMPVINQRLISAHLRY